MPHTLELNFAVQSIFCLDCVIPHVHKLFMLGRAINYKITEYTDNENKIILNV